MCRTCSEPLCHPFRTTHHTLTCEVGDDPGWAKWSGPSSWAECFCEGIWDGEKEEEKILD
jgi:hypothetical protein